MYMLFRGLYLGEGFCLWNLSGICFDVTIRHLWVSGLVLVALLIACNLSASASLMGA